MFHGFGGSWLMAVIFHCIYFHDLFGSDHGRLEDPHFLPDKTSWWWADSRNEDGESFSQLLNCVSTNGPRSHVGEVWRMIKTDRKVILMVWWCLLSLEGCDYWDNIGKILEFELQLTFPGQMVSQLYAYMVRNDKRSFASLSFLKNCCFWVVVSTIFVRPYVGKLSHLTLANIFQMGWFSHQPDFGKASCLKAVETSYSAFFSSGERLGHERV